MKVISFVVLVFLLSSKVFSAGMESTALKKDKVSTKYEVGQKWITKAKKFEKKNKLNKANKAYQNAIDALLRFNSKNPGDPDTLNLLGFAHRKVGDYDNAEIYYSMGLEINPKHVGINEYMGELYVVTNRMGKARERLAILKDCNCQEYNDLKQVIEGTKKSKY